MASSEILYSRSSCYYIGSPTYMRRKAAAAGGRCVVNQSLYEE